MKDYSQTVRLGQHGFSVDGSEGPHGLDVTAPDDTIPAAIDGLDGRESVWHEGRSDRVAIVAGTSKEFDAQVAGRLIDALMQGQPIPRQSVSHVSESPSEIIIEGAERAIEILAHHSIEMSHAGTILTLLVQGTAD